MTRNYFHIVLTALCCLVMLFSSCSNNDKKIITPVTTGQIADINNITVNLPNAKGVELVQANCASCHSLRYIEIQPNLPKASWKKIVKKMVGSYGAPIKDTNAINQIIEYLATVKGKK